MKRLLVAVAMTVAPSALVAQAAPAKPIEITLTEWKVALASDTIPAGSVTFNVKNEGNMSHSFFVLGGSVAQGTRDIAARQSASLKVTLKPGTYEIYCPMSDQSHKMAGMTRKIVVTPATSATPAAKP